MRKLLILLIAMTAVLGANAQQLQAIRNKVPDGYNFWFYAPKSVLTDSVVQKPLVIFLHGASLCGNNLDKVKRYGTINAIEKGRDIDAFVIAPQNPGGSWSPKKVMNVVDYVVANNEVDTTRIYVIGMSLGGYGTLDTAAKYPDRIAAAIGICGGATVKDLSGLAEMPLWVIHGTGDSAVSVSQSDKVVNAVKQAQHGVNRVHYDRIPGMNHSQPARVFYMPEVYDWLFKHSLTDKGRPLKPTPPMNTNTMKGAYNGLKHR